MSLTQLESTCSIFYIKNHFRTTLRYKVRVLCGMYLCIDVWAILRIQNRIAGAHKWFIYFSSRKSLLSAACPRRNCGTSKYTVSHFVHFSFNLCSFNFLRPVGILIQILSLVISIFLIGLFVLSCKEIIVGMSVLSYFIPYKGVE